MQLELKTWMIEGKRPLMQDSDESMKRREPSGDLGGRTRTKVLSVHDEAASHLYHNEDGLCFHPAMAFWKALLSASPNRILGSLAASTVVGTAVRPAEEEFILYDPATLNGKGKPKPLTEKDWVADVRGAVNHNCKPPARIKVARPKWRKWGGLLVLEIDWDLFGNLNGLTDLLNIAGRFGIGAGRIDKVGPVWGGINMGQFMATLIGPPERPKV